MTDRRITRVVFACDAVGESPSSVETAARLARWLDAALHGVFVEDEALLHLTAIPSVRHIGPGGESFVVSDEREVVHQFRAHAARMRAAIETAAVARAVGWSFAVVRGSPSTAVQDIGDQDLLVIEAESRPFAGSARLASRFLTAALNSETPILLLHSGAVASHDIVTWVQGTGTAAARLILLAAQLASAGNRSLTLFLGNNAADASTALDLVRSVSPELAQRCDIERPSQNTLANTATAGRLLVVDADPAINDAAILKELLSTTCADILFLR